MAAMAGKLPESFDEALRVARTLLSASSELVVKGVIETEAEQIVMEAYRQATGKKLSRGELFLRIRDRYPEVAGEKVLILSGARATGRLLQHLTGHQAFLDHEYQVSPDVLIPRPETELLFIRAAAELEACGAPPSTGLEIGIGSGILSIELLHRFPGLRMIASEVSAAALQLAEANFKAQFPSTRDASRLRLVRAAAADQVFEPFTEAGVKNPADFIISNPPYLLRSEADDEVGRHEPAAALFAPPGDPLFFYAKIASAGNLHLKPGGSVFLELPHERAGEIEALFKTASAASAKLRWNVRVEQDLNGRDRYLIGSWK